MKYLRWAIFLILISITISVEFSMIKEEIEIIHHKDTAQQIDYPVRLVYIDRINQWWPPVKIAEGMGVPGYAKVTPYNYIALAFWTYAGGPLDIVSIWADPIKYFGTDSNNPFGKTKD